MQNTVVFKGYRGVKVPYTQNFYYSDIDIYHACFSLLVAFMYVKKIKWGRKQSWYLQLKFIGV